MSASVHVSSGYAHYPKHAVPRGLLRSGTSEIKLYHLEKPGEPVPGDIAASARALLEGGGLEAAGLADDCGFVILHRCGVDFYFLLMGAWRGSNELWEAVWYRDAGLAAFAPFDPAYPAQAGTLRPTFCVWELGIVAHESAAWTRYLASAREEDDLERWHADFLEGPV